MPSLNEKLSEVQFYAYERPFMHCLYFICEHTFYARKNYATLEINPWGGSYYEYSSFPLSLKTNIFQFQFDQEGIESKKERWWNATTQIIIFY